MDCPRCGARLSRISFEGTESVYCERCRFADVESDHTRASAGAETWDDALRRFRTGDADSAADSAGESAESVDGDGDEDPVDSDREADDDGADAGDAAPGEPEPEG